MELRAGKEPQQPRRHRSRGVCRPSLTWRMPAHGVHAQPNLDALSCGLPHELTAVVTCARRFPGVHPGKMGTIEDECSTTTRTSSSRSCCFTDSSLNALLAQGPCRSRPLSLKARALANASLANASLAALSLAALSVDALLLDALRSGGEVAGERAGAENARTLTHLRGCLYTEVLTVLLWRTRSCDS